MKSPRIILSRLFNAAIRSVSPYERTKQFCDEIEKAEFACAGNGKLIKVVGFGKAACPMAQALEEELYERIDCGILITKYSHGKGYDFSRMAVYEAGHPVPDLNGVRATERVIDMVRESDEHTMIICLISGGGSALLVAPSNGITLEDKQRTTDLLLRSGADIHEMNIVRKHISQIKGGRLAQLAYPAHIVSLILSDVIGDEIDTIASGPTAPDRSTYKDALSVILKYDLLEKIPNKALNILRDGANGLIPETPKEHNPLFRNVRNIIIGSNTIALLAAQKEAKQLGFTSRIVSDRVSGEARDVGKWLASVTRKVRRQLARDSSKGICLISGGETTVTVKGTGFGGRNMEVALSFAIHIDGIQGVTLLSAGTDGTDGPTDAAGAIADGTTVERARSLGLEPRAFLDNNDTYTFFAKTGDLFTPGPTGTNVMDIQIILIRQNG